MADRSAYFEAILRRIHARHRESPPNGLGARDVDRWLASRDPALLAEAERETTRWLGLLNRLAELAEALIAADLRRLAHWCYAWGYALDPTLTDDPAAQRQVGANLALSGMAHPTQAAELREADLERFVDRLAQELALAQRTGAELRPVLPAFRRLVEAAGLSASQARLPPVEHVEVLRALTPLVWPFHLPRVEWIEPVTAFRLRLLGAPDTEIAPWLTGPGGPWWWVWTGDLGALASWIHRKTAHFRPLAPEAEAALDQLEHLVGPVDPDDEDHDQALTQALGEALSELHVALHATRLPREEALVLAFLRSFQGELAEADLVGLHLGDTRWIQTHHLPELLGRLAAARHHRGAASALRGVESLINLKGRS